MGLKISTFAKGGQTFTDVYAKVDDVAFDNDSKIASFGVKIYVSKTDKNLIASINGQLVRIEAGSDMIAQCYGKINSIITEKTAQIAEQQTAVDAITEDSVYKLILEKTLNQLKANDLLQLNGAVEW